MSQRTLKKKIPNRVYVVFYPKDVNEGIVTKAEHKKNKEYIDNIVHSTFPRAQEMISHSTDESVYSFTFNHRWDYTDKRSFMIRIHALFKLAQDFCPHFTTYEFPATRKQENK